MKATSRNGRRVALTGTVQALCGCVGDAMDGVGQDHPFPVVYVRLIIPCESGHPAKMAARCIERFPPHAVRAITAEQVAEILRAPVAVTS